VRGILSNTEETNPRTKDVFQEADGNSLTGISASRKIPHEFRINVMLNQKFVTENVT